MFTIQSMEKSFNEGTFNEVKLFHDFNLSVKKGDFISIIGSNGSGKSTLLNLISGNTKPDGGTLKFKGSVINHLPNYKRVPFMSLVHQDPSLGVAPSLTLLENLSMAWNKVKKNPFSRGIRKGDIPMFKAQLKRYDLGLENMLDKPVQLLSGGQRQAVSLLMAVIHKPELLLLDEHTAALDPKTAQKILELTSQIVTEYEVTTLMVTHNMRDALTYGNRLLMLNQGEIVLDLNEEEKAVYTSEDLIDAFKDVKGMELEDRLLLV